MADRLVSITEAAEAISVSRRTIQRRITDGSLEVQRDPRGRIIRIWLSQVHDCFGIAV